jgi:two-component system sensor histidine kinase YesM
MFQPFFDSMFKTMHLKEALSVENPFKRYPIRYVFFAAFSIFMTVLLAILAIVSYQVSIDQMKENTSYYQQNLLREINEQISIQKKSIEEVTLAMSRNSDLQQYLQGQEETYAAYRRIANINSSFFNIAFSIPMIDSIHVYLERAPLKVEQGPVRYYPFDEYERTDWLKALENSDSSWLRKHTIQSTQGETSVISFARKVYTANEKVAAILVVNMKATAFKSLIEGGNQEANRLLIDSAERLITYDGKLETGHYLEILNELKQNPDMNLNADGFTRYKGNFVVWSKLFNTDWLLLEITPWKEVAKGSIQLAALLFFIGMIAVGLVIILTFYLSRQFTKPIKLLLKTMDNFSLNRKEYDLPEDYQNEFGSLFGGYQKLMFRINKLYEDLEVEFQQKRKAEVDALQANINPHFLYNTLDQLNWMAIEAEQEKISQVLELMGKMFRIGLSKGESLIPIRDELTHLESYLQIQQIRLGTGFQYRIAVPEQYKVCYIPKLTLQPFVENAIMHGLHDRESGLIVIKLYEMKRDFYITIQDNGSGFKHERKVKQVETGGYGIKNVRERLAAYFGNVYFVSICSEEGIGTTVMIKIPKLIEGGRTYVESGNYR